MGHPHPISEVPSGDRSPNTGPVAEDVWRPGGGLPHRELPHQALLASGDRASDSSAFFLFAALAAIWASLSFRLAGVWETNSQYSHGWLVPFLAGWIFWRRWQTRPSPSHAKTALSAAVLLLALFPFASAWFLVESSPDWRPALWVLAACALLSSLALIQAAGGSRWVAHLAFPFFFALISVPWPFTFELRLTLDLSTLAAHATTHILQALGIVADRQGNVIILANEVLGVEEACSGIRSLQSSIMAGLFMGELYALRFWWRAVLCVTGILVAYLLNIVRMLLLSLFADAGGAASVAQWHDPAGFAILLITLGFLWVCCRILLRHPSAWRPEAARSPLGNLGGAARGVTPVAAGVILFLVLLIGSVEAWYRHRETAIVRAPGWTVPSAESGSALRDESLPENVQRQLQYDKGFQRNWTGEGGRRFHLIYLRWEPSRKAAAGTTPHLPEICQAVLGRKVVSKSEEYVTDVHGIPIRYHIYEIEAGARKIHLLYVPNDDRAGDQLLPRYDILNVSGMDQRWQRLRFALEGRRNTGQRSLQLALISEEDAVSARAVLTQMLPALIRREEPNTL